MAQEKIWDAEYRNPILVTKHDKPQADVLRFFKYLKKAKEFSIEGTKSIDLGSGTGRNTKYLAEKGSAAIGIEISGVAVTTARDRAKNVANPPKYLKQSMGEAWPVGDKTIDLALDVISSNSLNESERAVYLSELKRVLRPGAYVFVKTLCKDGDRNTAQLLKKFPGSEYDTYVMPDLGLTERVFSEMDFRELYSDLEILKLEKKTSHIPFNGQIFTRKFILAYLQLK
jgi:SAM-dependent methyltransferase